MRPNNDANERIYHKKLEAEDIVFKGAVAVPPSAQKLIAYLNQKSPKNTSDPMKLVVVNEADNEAVVATLGQGEFFGECCLAGQPQRVSTAATIMPSTILVIKKPEMIRLLNAEQAFRDQFIKHLLARYLRTEENSVDQLFNSAEKRLARTLLLLVRHGAAGHPQNMLPQLSQETLAEMIGTTWARVSFFMNKFRKLRFIQYEDQEIRVNNSLLGVVLHD